jgi:hypothetical protein
MEASGDKKNARQVLWILLNSAFGIWLLTTIVGGLGVWGYQQWRDSHQEEQGGRLMVQKLDLEISARLAQYLGWFQQHAENRKKFKEYVTPAFLEATLQRLAGRPVYDGDRDKPAIFEVFPEFKDRNLVGLYAERASLNKRMNAQLEERRQNPSRDNFSESKELVEYGRSLRGYERAMTGLLAPRLRWNEADKPDYDSFRRNFSDAFLNNISYDFPYTDCFDC